MSEFEGEVDDLDKMSKEYEKFRSRGKEHSGNVGYHQKIKYLNHKHRTERNIQGQ